MLGGNIMNDKSKDLLKKMCFVLEIVRGTCLISVALLIGLSLFYAFNKDVYNTLFGSIRIDFLQLMFKDDTALQKRYHVHVVTNSFLIDCNSYIHHLQICKSD